MIGKFVGRPSKLQCGHCGHASQVLAYASVDGTFSGNSGLAATLMARGGSEMGDSPIGFPMVTLLGIRQFLVVIVARTISVYVFDCFG
jgi:hypothetical protein